MKIKTKQAYKIFVFWLENFLMAKLQEVFDNSGGESQMMPDIFSSLNEKQKQALVTTKDSVLQIIAGPGTGKTKLLVARVAYLLLHFKLEPSQVIVTTFTKKAANEMKERLEILCQNRHDINLKMLHIGTFHSICYGYLNYYGHSLGINRGFKLADKKDQTDLLKKAIEKINSDELKSDKSTVKAIQSYISRQKSLGRHPEDVPISDTDVDQTKLYYQVYEQYHQLLIKNNLMDFDDILVYTEKLLDLRPDIATHVKHVLVDEFQDTNTIQLRLVFKLTRYCNNNMTVVGDADQSIYGFRNATYENFKIMENMMKEQGRNFVKITLDQNYRSTNSILKLAEQVMAQQQDREPKKLNSNKPGGGPVFYAHLPSPKDEPAFISDMVNHHLKDEDSLFTYKDIAIIVRVSRKFLSIERELFRRGIPYRIVKGFSFWELREISMTIDLLKIIGLDDWLSFKRVIDWFCDGIGPKMIEKFENIIFYPGVVDARPYQTLVELAAGKRPGVPPKARASLISLTSKIKECRDVLLTESKEKFYHCVCSKFKITEIACKKKSASKDEEEVRKEVSENLVELKNQFVSYNPEQDEFLKRAQEDVFQKQDLNLRSVKVESSEDNEEIKTVQMEDEINIRNDSKTPMELKLEFLLNFLDHIYLAESVAMDDKADDETGPGRITLTTIHAAKGLEWPIVFLPALINGILPSNHALTEQNDTRQQALDEERRCFYVALTRAKEYLYLSSYSTNDYMPAEASQFIRSLPEDLYVNLSPNANFGIQGMNLRNFASVQYTDSLSTITNNATKYLQSGTVPQTCVQDVSAMYQRSNNIASSAVLSSLPARSAAGSLKRNPTVEHTYIPISRSTSVGQLPPRATPPPTRSLTQTNSTATTLRINPVTGAPLSSTVGVGKPKKRLGMRRPKLIISKPLASRKPEV